MAREVGACKPDHPARHDFLESMAGGRHRRKRNKQRAVDLSAGGLRYVAAWLEHRGDAPAHWFCPVDQTGEIRISRLRGESVAYILKSLSAVTHLLHAGVDVLTVQKLAGPADVTTTTR